MDKAKIKAWLEANVWDGEDVAGCKSYCATFNPDDLLELVEELIEDLSSE